MRGPGTSVRWWSAVVAVVATCFVGVSDVGASSSEGLSNTPAGVQASWLLKAANHLPISTTEIDAHFDTTFLGEVSPAQLNSGLRGAGTLTFRSVKTSSADAIVFIGNSGTSTQYQVSMSVDAKGLISGLLIAAVVVFPPTPKSWSAFDAMAHSVAPKVRVLVAKVVGNTCQTVHAVHATTAAPLGSSFKLYVLDALAKAVESGRVSWKQRLTITKQLKSLPSGVLQNDPVGTRISVAKVAAEMISISDNTAANMLINLVGRNAVEAATIATGMANPSLDNPFLTTRELFVLKLYHWPALAKQFRALQPSARVAFLTKSVDPIPLDELDAKPWTTPRDINTVEWFASPIDLCHVYAVLHGLAATPALSDVSKVLEINDGGIDLNSKLWPTVWFKGGSEPGVLTLNYLATTSTGSTYFVSVLAENSSAPIKETPAAIELLSAIKGAFALARR